MIDSNPTPEDRDRVLFWLAEFNRAENEEFMRSLSRGAEQAIFLVSKDENQALRGGLRGSILHRWLKIEVMAVRPGERGRGVGRELVRMAEQLAVRHGCLYAYVDTMSYQAPDFYARLGYRESGRLENWDSHGHDKIFFTKTLLNRSDEELSSPAP